MVRKIISLIAIFSILTVSLGTSFGNNIAYGDEKLPFNDVENHWAKDYIKYAVNKKLFSGTSNDTFSPDVKITRAMFITILGRFDKNVVTYGDTTYKDVKKDAYYSNYVNWAVNKGLIKPISDNYFGPDKELTREEVAVIIGKYIKDINFNYDKYVIEYSDLTSISIDALAYVNQLKILGIMSGKDNNNFKPKDTLTRAETAAIFYRLDAAIDNTIR